MSENSSVIIKWSGKNIPIDGLKDTTTVGDLKMIIEEKTCVKVERQKLLNLKLKGKAPGDEDLLTACNFKNKMKIMMMGSVEKEIEDVLTVPKDIGNVVNDLDDISEEVEIKLQNMQEHLAKIDRRVKEYSVKHFNDPRPGKKLLVLDIDYTLFDHRSNAEKAVELMRPYLHDFLALAYEFYDIVIWSATGMRWIEAKMKELGVTDNPRYKIAFFMDHGAMITVHTPHYGVIDTKPLGVIWGKYPEFYSSENTIMFDDLRRNFLMNPQNGLKIRPFRSAHQSRDSDVELKNLAAYLYAIKDKESFKDLKHKHWESYLSKSSALKSEYLQTFFAECKKFF